MEPRRKWRRRCGTSGGDEQEGHSARVPAYLLLSVRDLPMGDDKTLAPEMEVCMMVKVGRSAMNAPACDGFRMGLNTGTGQSGQRQYSLPGLQSQRIHRFPLRAVKRVDTVTLGSVSQRATSRPDDPRQLRVLTSGEADDSETPLVAPQGTTETVRRRNPVPSSLRRV